MAFGPVAYDFRSHFNDQFQALEFSALVASGAGAALAGHPFLCNGANLAYRKEAFMQVKGFEGNEKYLSGDDVFLLHKLKREFGKGSILFCKDKRSLVWTYPVPGFSNFISQRARWASKSKGYKDQLSILTALIVFSYSLTVLLSFIAGFCDSKFFLISGGLLLWKIIVDLPLMMRITGFFNQKKIMKWYPIFQVIYPFYVIITGFLSFFGRKSW
jgi:cellulose synthase/poly-beta-1,6-N-acetylglucosamine synthase-like glycosyltransferase